MAKTEPAVAADVDEDPSEDTPVDETEDQTEDTPEQPAQPIDWEARFHEKEREANKVISRQGAELALLRRGEDPDEPDDDDDEVEDDQASPAPPADRSAQRLERDSWELAETRYGREAVDAYDAARRILRRAQTPADYIAAFEAYYDLRSNGATVAEAPAATAKKAGRARAVQPTVDTNQSDAGPDRNDLENQFAEAKAKGSLGAFVHAATTALGFTEGGKPRRG